MPGPPSDAELHEVLRTALPVAGFAAPQLIRRRPSEYRTSFPLEELELKLEDGSEPRLAFKRLEWDALTDEARLAKPEFLHDPRREPAVYAELLASAASGAPSYYGSVIEPEAGRHWLFIEWVEGRELYQVGERELWEEAARWLARFHLAMAPQLDRHRREGRLIDHDAGFYRRWIERASEFAARSGDESAAAVAWLRERHEPVVEALLALPRTVLHGEFYASNVLVAADFDHPPPVTESDVRVAPVDWELAAAGPGLTDLAALVGGWPEADREALVAAYAGEPGVPSFTPRALDLARLQVAIQWLGWAPPEWVPPEGQRHDWLSEAIAIAEGLGL